MKREIWISDKNKTLFDHGIIYFPDGRVEEMSSIPDKTSFKPSVWLGCPGNFFIPDYAIRWIYSANVIRLRFTESDEIIVLHNERIIPVYIYGYQVLQPGESCEITGESREKHVEFLKQSNILGFYLFVQTNDRNAKEHTGKCGMLLSSYGLNRKKQNLRFVIIDSKDSRQTLENVIEINQCRVTDQSKSKIILKKFMKSYTFTTTEK